MAGKTVHANFHPKGRWIPYETQGFDVQRTLHLLTEFMSHGKTPPPNQRSTCDSSGVERRATLQPTLL